jgi:hypothetical protein
MVNHPNRKRAAASSSIVVVKIDHPDGRGYKSYRYDLSRGEPENYYGSALDSLGGGKVIAQKSDQDLRDGLDAVVCRSMYPLPFDRWSRAVALAWLTEMDRRGLVEFDADERLPTIRFGWE